MTSLNTSDPKPVSVLIVGGGITGLSAAYYLQQQAASLNTHRSITLVEADHRLGGKIITEQVDDFTVEGGPDCFLRQKPWAIELANELGITDDLIGTNDERRKIFVLNKGKLTPLPEGVMLIVPTRIMPFALSPLISWPGKIRMGMDWIIPKRKSSRDESVGAFIRRRLGREALDKIAEPLLSGIHVSDPEKQSMMATFPRFRMIEEKHGSLIRGMLSERKKSHTKLQSETKPPSIFMSFKKGVSQLTQTLEDKLSNCCILKGRRVISIEYNKPGSFKVRLDNNDVLYANTVILATPAEESAKILVATQTQTAKLLTGFESVSTATISLAYRMKDIHKPFNGFGFVVPGKEGRKISACTWSSFKFINRAPSGYILLRCFVGGPGKEELVDFEDKQLIQTVRQELNRILELEATPVFNRIYRWRKANPQYNLGHIERVRQVKVTGAIELPGIFFTGASFEGVGIPDCVNQGKKAAMDVIQFLQKEKI